MTRRSLTDARCAALFASALQQSDVLTAQAVADAIGSTVRQLGLAGCAGRVAQEFGDHPEIACARMRWARQVIGQLSAAALAAPARRAGCAA